MASIHKHTTKSGDRRYVVRYRDPSRRQQQRTLRRRTDAERFRNAIEAAKDQGIYVDPHAGDVAFEVMAELWLDTRIDRAQSTRDRDRSCLRSLILPNFGERPIRSITPSEIETWLAIMDKAPNTRGRALQILRSILDLARRDRVINTNPASDVKPPPMKPQRVSRALTDAEITSVVEAAEDIDERTAVIIYLMARCGLRIGEALALRRRDVDLDANTISVHTSMSRREGVRPVKGRHREDEGRTLPIPQDVSRRLSRHFTERSITGIDGFVVTAPRGGPLRYTNWRNRVWTRIVKRVGLPITPHDLRRTAATRLFVEDRWTPAEVQAYLGHLDPRITLGIYTLVETETLPRPSALNTKTI